MVKGAQVSSGPQGGYSPCLLQRQGGGAGHLGKHREENELEVAQAALATIEVKALADVAATWAEAAKEAEEEFGAYFFQGY